MTAPGAAAFVAPLGLGQAPSYRAQPPPAPHTAPRALRAQRPATQAPAGAPPSPAWLAVGAAAWAAAAAAQRRRKAAVCLRAECGYCGLPPAPDEAAAAPPAEGASAEERFVLDAVSGSTRRAAATGGAPAAAALVLERPAEAVARCIECVGEGIVDCGSCRASGQFKMFGDRGVGEGMSYQYIECPDCYGSGTKLCPKCSGTGLPAKRLVGFLRDPAFRQFVARIRAGRVDVDNVKEIQAEIQQMVALQERNKALKAADEAMKQEQDSGFFKLPNFF